MRLLLQFICTIAWITPVTSAVDIFVDQNHSQAEDRNAGTSDAPLKTISAAALRTSPGDRVMIKSGVYNEVVHVRVSGTKDRPIQYIADIPGGAIIDGGLPQIQFRKTDGDEPIYNCIWQHKFIIDHKDGVSIESHPPDFLVHGRADLMTCDGLPLLQVANLEELRETYRRDKGQAQPAVPGLGKFGGMVWINPRGGTAHFWLHDGADPEKHEIKIADKPKLFGCEPGELPEGVQHIHVKGIVFRNASNFAQRAAVWLYGRDNLLEDCVIETVAGQGVAVNGTMRRCIIRNCGAIGGSATGEDFVNDSCLWENNCWKPYDRGWEAGGAKIALAKNGIFKNCVFRHNGGPGLWLDVDCRNIRIENCIFADNEQSGLLIEISRNVQVDRSLFQNNGLGAIGEKRETDWGIAGITIAESQNCSLRSCTLFNNRDGIAIREQGPRTINTDGHGEVTYINQNLQLTSNYVANNRGYQLALWWDNAFFGPHPSEEKLYPTNEEWKRRVQQISHLLYDPSKQKIEVQGNLFEATPAQKLILMGAPWRNRSRDQEACADLGANDYHHHVTNFEYPDDLGWIEAPRDVEEFLEKLKLPKVQ